MQQHDFTERVRFLAEVARRLHQYGTAAPRLEAAIARVSKRLGLRVEPLCTPTSITLSITDGDKPEGALADHTQIIRMRPGDVDLARLAEVDRIADDASLGRIDIAEGYRQLRAVQERSTRIGNGLKVICFGLVAAAAVVLFKTGIVEVLSAFALGVMVGALALLAESKPRLAEVYEALAAMLVSFIAIFIHTQLAPVSVSLVSIASMIVLLPGLMLTTAVNELANEHLVSGMARFAGAMAVLLKLTFGAAAGVQLAHLMGWQTGSTAVLALPAWTEWIALVVAGLAFVVLFKATLKDAPVVVLATVLGYLATRIGGHYGGSSEFGVFIGGLCMGALGNLYGRIINRPGAIVRVPGIILMVPGSVGFKSLFFVFERDVYLGLDMAFSMVVLLACLVTGLLFGNLLVPPRRAL